MSVTYKYQCPDCKGYFSYMHHPSKTSDPGPAACPICGYSPNKVEEYVQQPSAPLISKPVNKSPEMVYRQMEKASEARAVEAAEQLGCNVSEVEGIKITDLKDNLQEGDMCTTPPAPADVKPPPVAINNITPQGSLMTHDRIQEYTRITSTLGHNEQGMRGMDHTRQLFQTRSSAMIRAGQMNRE